VWEKIFNRVCLKIFESYQIYTLKASPIFLSRIQIYSVQRILTKYFTAIPDSLLEVLVPVLLGNMSNILIKKYI